jgi:AcrR family transcriptional regulator
MAATTEPRLPLSRDRILQAALELADEHGIDALSMRRLGQSLGFEAMSLYNHVANKDDLLDGILDLVLAEAEPAAADASWDEAIRSSAISMHAAFRQHPWASALLMSSAHMRPARLRQMDSLLELLRGAGFSSDATYHAYHVLDGYITGFTLWETGHSFTAADMTKFAGMVDQMLPVEEYPALNEHAAQHLAEGPHRDVSAFEFGLDLILEGLRKLRPR